jgi:hypothetical protein
MATLYIAEYSNMATAASSMGPAFVGAQCPQEPAVAEQTVSIGVSHAESSAFNANTRFIRVHCDAICSIVISASPVATASNKRLAANQTEFFGVSPGMSLSVITNT